MSASLRALGRWAPAAAIAALAGLCVNAVLDRDAATFVMSGLSLCGVVALYAVGARRGAVLILSLGLIAMIVLIDSGVLGHPRAVTSVAHLVVGGLLAWAIAAPVSARVDRSRLDWIRAVFALILGAAVAWEAGEWITDRIFDTKLQPSAVDSALDIAFAAAGAALAVLVFAQIRAREAD